MKTKVIILAALLVATSAGRAFGMDPAPAKPESRVSVILIDPQKFTDAKRDSWSDSSSDLLDQIQAFLRETGEKFVPAGMHLEIKVTDIDLAGEFEPWRGPQFDDVRIVRAIYPPRIDLEFRLTDAKGNVVRSGKRDLGDLTFQMRMAWPPDDYLRFEKDILRDWFRQEFGGLKKT